MQYVKSYYATTAIIRYYGPGLERRWPDAPHVAFANLQLDDASLRMFTRRYGPLYLPKTLPNPDVAVIDRHQSLLWAKVEIAQAFVPDVARAKDMQALLVKAWRRDKSAIANLEHEVMQQGLRPWFGVTEQVLDLKDAPREALTLWADNIWTVVRIAFLMDVKVGRAKICKSPDCPAPHFSQSRKGQEFCSHKCAVLINVRRFREIRSKDRERGTQRNLKAVKSGGRSKADGTRKTR